MNNSQRHWSWILKTHRRVKGAALVLAILAVVVVATGSAKSQTYSYSVLHEFTGVPDGSDPNADLVLDAQRNLYGTTPYGGSGNCNDEFGTVGCGTVFKVDTTGNETVLHSFTGTDGDGAFPTGGLVLDAQGNLYGTTSSGGTFGGGTVFKMTSTGGETVIYSFGSQAGDGGGPTGLVLDAEGNFYGTTAAGGRSVYGTVFKVDPAGNETVLYSFTGIGGDGAEPLAGVVLDAQGNLYGTTLYGGDDTCKPPLGCGTVFKVDTTGNESVLHRFESVPDGEDPRAGLVLDAEGNLYGTTYYGGNTNRYRGNGLGTVFKVDTNGIETVLYRFCQLPSCKDGGFPLAGLVIDAQGNLYGTTSYPGTAFILDTSGTETVLHRFPKDFPSAGVLRDGAGNLYGTNAAGGDLACTYNINFIGCGTIFDLLAPVAATTTTLTSAPNPSIYGRR
jgi:uncharacterized repeat protein (TIGR03803 family)